MIVLAYVIVSLALASAIGHAPRARDEEERREELLDRLNRSNW